MNYLFALEYGFPEKLYKNPQFLTSTCKFSFSLYWKCYLDPKYGIYYQKNLKLSFLKHWQIHGKPSKPSKAPISKR